MIALSSSSVRLCSCRTAASEEGWNVGTPSWQAFGVEGGKGWEEEGKEEEEDDEVGQALYCTVHLSTVFAAATEASRSAQVDRCSSLLSFFAALLPIALLQGNSHLL